MARNDQRLTPAGRMRFPGDGQNPPVTTRPRHSNPRAGDPLEFMQDDYGPPAPGGRPRHSNPRVGNGPYSQHDYGPPAPGGRPRHSNPRVGNGPYSQHDYGPPAPGGPQEFMQDQHGPPAPADNDSLGPTDDLGLHPPEFMGPPQGDAPPGEAPQGPPGQSGSQQGGWSVSQGSMNWNNRPQYDAPSNIPDAPEGMPEPTEWEVTREQTVQGQMEDILANDSSLMEMIRQRYQVAASANGLQNSSMAAAAGEMAVAQMAFEIGSRDAATFARSAEFNAMTRNQFSMAERQFMYQATLNEQNFQHATSLQREQIAGQLAAVNAQVSGQIAVQQLRNEGQYQLAELAQMHWMAQNSTLFEQGMHELEVRQGYTLEQMLAQHGYNIDLRNLDQDHWIARAGIDLNNNLALMDAEQMNVLERMFTDAELQLIQTDFEGDIQAALSDQDFRQNWAMMNQEYGWRTQMGYASDFSAFLNSWLQTTGFIGSSGASPEQQAAAINQLNDMMPAIIDLLNAAWMGAMGGPGSSNYGWFGPPPPSEDRGANRHTNTRGGG